MFKSILLFLLILAVSIAIGVGIFHLIQPSGQIFLRSGSNNFVDFGGRHEGRGGFNVTGGLFGMTGNLIVVAVITFIIVSARNILSWQSEPAAVK
jgi:uncharacterized membrane protein